MQGRLYMSDHHVIDNLQHEQGYATYAAKVLYYLLDNGKLATVAVQLGQSPR